MINPNVTLTNGRYDGDGHFSFNAGDSVIMIGIESMLEIVETYADSRSFTATEHNALESVIESIYDFKLSLKRKSLLDETESVA